MAAASAWVGYKYGQDYLDQLTQADLLSETWVVDLLGGQLSYMLSIVCGILAPISLFWAGVLCLHLILGGLLEFRPARIVVGLAVLAGMWLIVQLFMIPASISATLAALAVVATARVLEWVLIRLGWY